jgi:hypothetical protein
VYNAQQGYLHFGHSNFDMEYSWLFLGDEVTCGQDSLSVCLSVCPHAVPGHSSLANSHHILWTGVIVQAVPFPYKYSSFSEMLFVSVCGWKGHAHVPTL